MKLAILFIISLYIGIPSIALMPILIGNLVESAVLCWVILSAVFLAVTGFMFASGILSVIKAVNSDTKSAVRMWRTIKLAAVPIYVLNFIFFALFGVMMFPTTVIMGFASGFFCCSGIVLSGITGITAIKKAESDNISKIHYALQLIPVLDVISTLIIAAKLPASRISQ